MRRLLRLSARIKRRFASKALILLYHRVIELPPSDPQLLCVTPQHFSEHLEYLERNYRIIPLRELGEMLRKKHLPRRAVAITFDDGYADNFFNAKPLLEHYEAPATIFVSTSYLGQKQEFWWDELERTLLLPEELPESLELNINNNLYSWEINNLISRQKAYKQLHAILYSLESRARSQALAYLINWAGLRKDGRPNYYALNPEDLKSLSANGLIDIGSHGITHDALSSQPAEIQRREIIESKLNLENILGRSVDSFAYAFGGRADVGDTAINLVRQAGYKIGCANFYSCVTAKSDFYFLPRFLIRDWDKEEFARQIKKVFSN